MAEKLIENVYWLGMDNPEGRNFHGIDTPRGGSYNSYLIMDEKPTIIDGTNEQYFSGYIESLKTIVDPEKVEYIVVNHAEPDHAGAMKKIGEVCKNAKILCTEKGKDFLLAAFDVKNEIVVVSEGEEVSIGSKTLRFLNDPMVHWPETMMTYLIEDKVLFPADLFGTEIAHETNWADEMDDFTKLTRDYFTLVMRPFAMAVEKAVVKVRELKLAYILPSHGPGYRENLNIIIDYYEKLATSPEENKVLVVYNSIWHSTQKMANEIAQGVIGSGSEVSMIDINDTNNVRLLAEVLTAKSIAVGSLTILGSYHPVFETFFSYLKLIRTKGKKAVTFGTYGWVSSSVGKLKERLEELNFEVIDTIDFRFGPKSEEDFKNLREIGSKLANIEVN